MRLQAKVSLAGSCVKPAVVSLLLMMSFNSHTVLPVYIILIPELSIAGCAAVSPRKGTISIATALSCLSLVCNTARCREMKP